MRKISLLIVLPLIILVFTSLNSSKEEGQRTFKIIQFDTKFSNEFCVKAISEAKWCGFRYENKRNLIQFDTGLKVELFSTREINLDNPNCILTDYRDFSKDEWRFTPEGKIIHLVAKNSKK
jgi:hypothetical protein